MSEDTPIVRKRIRSIEVNVRSEYSKSLVRWGYLSQIQLNRGERMRDKMTACFAGVKAKLASEIPGIKFNAPEIFPVDQRQCVVLITGWKPETILIS